MRITNHCKTHTGLIVTQLTFAQFSITLSCTGHQQCLLVVANTTGLSFNVSDQFSQPHSLFYMSTVQVLKSLCYRAFLLIQNHS